MNRHTTLRPLRAALFLAPLFAPLAARADRAATLVHLEIGGTAAPYQVELSLTDRGCATSSDTRDRWQYEIKVCREGGDEATPALSFEVLRSERTSQGPRTQRAQIHGILARGKRVPLATQRGDGGTPLEVTALVR
jgi:hypothetical protein